MREKLQRIFRSHKIRSTFYSENTLHKILCKPTKYKNNVVCEIDCGNCETVYFDKSEWSLK